MKGVLIVLLLVALAVVVLMTGETASSYCGDLVDGGDLPAWADGYFRDYNSCVEWYEDNQPRPGER